MTLRKKGKIMIYENQVRNLENVKILNHKIYKNCISLGLGASVAMLLQSLIKLILFSILIFSLEGCFVKNITHSNFWDNFFSNQQLLIDKYADTDLYPILFGSLKPEEEKFLFKKDDTLYLTGYVSKQNETKIIKIDNKEEIADNDEYFTKVEYTKSTFKGRETYKLKRNTIFKYPAYTMKDFFHWLEVFSSSVNSDEQLALLDRSIVYQFLCAEFRCQSELSENHASLSFTLDERMKLQYKTFYTKLNEALGKVKFKVKYFSKTKKIGEIYSEGKTIYAKILNFKKGELQNLDSLTMFLEVDLNFYGLKIHVQNLEYHLSMKYSESEEVMTGKFPIYPKYKVSGRLFYFLPPGIINIFIPQDIDSYMADYFDLLTRSGDSEGANFTTRIKKLDGNQVHVNFESYSEIFQKPFRPLASHKKEKREGRDFYLDLRNKIVEDLKP